jgi:uncharacterized membrane protein YeaQ/YmgE (transglycosylase-associated protein family)
MGIRPQDVIILMYEDYQYFQLVETQGRRILRMGILSWIIIGIIAGWLTGLIMKGGGYGIFGDMILGIVGALVGGFLASALFGIQAPLSGFNIGTLVIAVLGAILVVAIVRALPGRTRV